MQKIILSKLQKKILLDHTHKEDPNESCAILYGNKNGEENIVKEIWLTENIDSSPVEFTLSPEQTWEMDKKSKELKNKIFAFGFPFRDGVIYSWEAGGIPQAPPSI